MKISSWNLNGWTLENKHLRELLIKNVGSDIYCFSETHLPHDGNILVENYVSFVNNRKFKHRNAPKPSGGVAILVKDSVFNDFKVQVIDKELDGIIGLEFINKNSGFSFVVFSCYLSPDNSVWGRDPSTFFSHLISQMYLNCESDFLVVCGDLNGRVGNASDCVEGIDDLPPRRNIDNIKSGHGEAIIDFVKDTRSAILNGRFKQEKDNFTFVSPRGKSVVDYFITPQDCVNFCDSFEVDLVSDLLNKFDLYPLLSNTCKAPDHSLLTLQFRYTYMESAARAPVTVKDNLRSEKNAKRYNFRTNEGSFFNI